MLIVRRVGALALAAAAVLVWFLLAPAEEPKASADFSSDISAVLADYELNNASASSAPQQEVVNGWVTKDLLAVIAKEQNAALSPSLAPSDDRIPAELLLTVLGIALFAFTSPGNKQPAAFADSIPTPGACQAVDLAMAGHPGTSPATPQEGLAQTSGRRIKDPTSNGTTPPTA